LVPHYLQYWSGTGISSVTKVTAGINRLQADKPVYIIYTQLMDSRIINEKAMLFKDRILRITPALFQQFGLVKKNVYLKIDEFFLSCIPFDLSLSGASLLGSLSQKEISFFEQMVGHPQKLYLSFIPPYTKKPISYFIMSDILAFRKPNPDSAYCFIDVKFKDAPFDLKETLVTYFVENDESEEFFKTAEASPFESAAVISILGSNHVTVYHENQEFPYFKVLQLTAKTIRIFGEIDGEVPATGTVLELESSGETGACQLYASITGSTPYSEVPGFVFLDLNLNFNPCLISKMRKFM
jgi:hypothetical protein